MINYYHNDSHIMSHIDEIMMIYTINNNNPVDSSGL